MPLTPDLCKLPSPLTAIHKTVVGAHNLCIAGAEGGAPCQGMLEALIAAEAALMARGSGSLSPLLLMRVPLTCACR